MRIVIASDLHWPSRNGVGTFGRTLAQGLADAGHDVMVIAPSQTGGRYIEIDKNHEVARVTSLPAPFFPTYRISLNPGMEVKQYIADFKPDLIHIQTPLGIGFAARQAAKKMNIPVVATNHAMPENVMESLRAIGPFAKPARFILEEYGEWFHGNGIDYVTMPTKTAVDMFKEIGDKLNLPIKAISCGINLSRFKPGKRDKKLMSTYNVPDKPIVLYAGRLDAEKHISVLVNAFKLVRDAHDTHLVISGGGNDEDNLKNQVHALGLDKHVSFLGRVSDEELPLVYNLGDVFVMPSPAELQSIVTMEAMASGVPIVSVDAGPLYELCHDGENGYLCRVDDPADMASKINKILANGKLQERMGDESVAIAKTHDIRHTVTEYEKVYDEAIARHKVKKSKK